MILPSHNRLFFFKETSLKKGKTSDTCASKCIQTFYFAKEIKQIEIFLEPLCDFFAGATDN